MLELYKNIKEERLKKGWTQSDLAQKMGYSDKSMIAKIEAGKVDLPQTKIRLFAKIFNCTESQLMGWSDVVAELTPIYSGENTIVLNDNEYKLYEEYLKLDEESKRQLLLMLDFLKSQQDKK